MKLKFVKPTSSRDLYGKVECEHCGTEAELRGGYDDGFWHDKVLPAWHCKVETCGKNRAGELRTPEVVERNIANGINGV